VFMLLSCIMRRLPRPNILLENPTIIAAQSMNDSTLSDDFIKCKNPVHAARRLP
jgi:hypothetical protein